MKRFVLVLLAFALGGLLAIARMPDVSRRPLLTVFQPLEKNIMEAQATPATESPRTQRCRRRSRRSKLSPSPIRIT